MNPFEMVIGIVLIVTIGRFLSVKYGHGRRHRGIEDQESDNPRLKAENERLREEMLQLKERVKVLERITVEKENSLSREIEDLRNR